MKKILLVLILLLAMLSVAALPMQRCDTKTIEAKAIDSHGCNPDESGFVITNIPDVSLAPLFITVTWDNGEERDIPIDKDSQGNPVLTGSTAH